MQERGATKEDVLKAIEGRKEDFGLYVEPQKKLADIVIQVRSGQFRTDLTALVCSTYIWGVCARM